MMDLPKAPKRCIDSYKKEGERYVFLSERGRLAVSFVKKGIPHIHFSLENNPAKNWAWIQKNVSDIPVSFREDKENYYISDSEIEAVISKKYGSLSFYRNGVLLFSEDESYDRELETVREYITVDDEKVVTKDVKTADGIKKIVESSNKLEGRLLYRTRLHLKFSDDEALYGLGQSEEGVLNLRGHIKYLHQANRKIAIPVIMSQKGYGLYFPTGSTAIFCDNENGTFFQTEADEAMEYFFLGGKSMDESVSMMRFLTGKAELLPRWAYGYLQSKERYESEEELLSIAGEFRKRHIGLDALILDWITWEDNMWGQKTLDPKRFPDPERMTQKLHDENVRLMISIWPNMTSICDNHKEFKEKKLLFTGTEVYNALSKEGRDIYWKQVKEGLYCHGLDGFWCDSSEPFTPEWTKQIRPDAARAYRDFTDEAQKSMPYDEINAYGFYHALGIYEGQRKTSKNRIMNLTRSGYPGSQKLGTVLWSGDIGASFDTLKRQVAEGLNFSATGLPYWTIDIGAFFVKKGAPWYWEGKYPEGTDSEAYKELFVRWYQYGAFLPVFRAHGTDCAREPWRFGEKGDMFYDAIVAANELRYRLMPYIYSVAYKVWKDDYTMMRLLSFDYPTDRKVWDISDQYMFGPSLMVCPVLSEMYYDVDSNPLSVEKEREVYFPEGNNWVDIRDGKLYEGGTTKMVSADISSIPVFAVEGSLIPMCDKLESTAELEKAEITPVLFGKKSACFDLFMDEGDGYDYQTKKESVVTLSYDATKDKLEVTGEGAELLHIKELKKV